MQVISKAASMRRLSDAWKKRGDTLGFVPTMGALHVGHAALIRLARRKNKKVVVSIFVNPTQFGPQEDFAKYPRTWGQDLRLCKELGVDAIFHPSAEEMYPEGFCSTVTIAGLSERLCGPFRPGHFSGVATVVLKLFEIVNPSRAYFGEKDYQQLTIIRRMVRDFNLACHIVGCPTIREKDGLALSSRNRYLSQEERAIAPTFYRILSNVAQKVHAGVSPKTALKEAKGELLEIPGLTVDYVSCVDSETLEDLKKVNGPARVISAIRIGKVRLIDNVAVAAKT